MTKREKVIVGLMVGTVLWGGTTVFLDHLQKKQSSGKIEEVRTSVKAFAGDQRALLAELRLSRDERRLLDTAAAPWAESPFLQRIAAARPLADPVVTFVYNGFIQASGLKFALINGREYRSGEQVMPTDFVVESIEPDRVVLKSESGGRRMTIALQSISQKRESP